MQSAHTHVFMLHIQTDYQISKSLEKNHAKTRMLDIAQVDVRTSIKCDFIFLCLTQQLLFQHLS